MHVIMVSCNTVVEMVPRLPKYRSQLYHGLKKWTIPTREMATQEHSVDSNPFSEVMFECRNNRGIITLNKPKALNAINYPMVCRITEKLQEWESTVDMVIMRGTGRAFCAGGDIVDITRDGPAGSHKGKMFFKHEYLMDNYIGTYRKPYIALIDGITMGGGIGLSVHGRFRVATENTLCAMPETAIGLIPDVGGSYFLPRLNGELGMYLALTGHRLKGTDVAKAGIATHYCESSSIPKLYDALINKIDPCNIDKELEAYTLPTESFLFSLSTKKILIDQIFSLNSIEEIMDALIKEGSDFSLKTFETLNKMSPMSLKLTMRALRKGKHMTLQECFQMENRIVHTILSAEYSKDFYEGVRALLVDKDKKPAWEPKLDRITESMVEAHFKPLCSHDELEI